MDMALKKKTDNIVYSQDIFIFVLNKVGEILSLYSSKNKNNTEKEDTKEDPANIIMHSIFNNIELYKNEIGDFDNIENEGVKRLFQLVLYKHIDLFGQYAEKLKDDYESGKIKDKRDLYQSCNKMTNHLNSKLYNFHLREYEYDEDEVRAISIVLKHFKRWNQKRSTSYTNKTHEIAQSSLYPELFNALVSILDLIDMILLNIINDTNHLAYTAISELNGLTYKGVELNES